METAFFFGLPFGIAGMVERFHSAGYCIDMIHSLADEEEHIGKGLMLAELDGIGGSTGREILIRQECDTGLLQRIMAWSACNIALE